ncbi:hypothetical protein ACFWEB_14065 [Streptomyces parvus]|uniref:hypothetical protein n=1 Tax=Streptomyces parvus TaxID=66428 RepID=UPI003664A410
MSRTMTMLLPSGLLTQKGRSSASSSYGSSVTGSRSMPRRQSAGLSTYPAATKASLSSGRTNSPSATSRYQSAVSAGTTFPAERSNS